MNNKKLLTIFYGLLSGLIIAIFLFVINLIIGLTIILYFLGGLILAKTLNKILIKKGFTPLDKYFIIFIIFTSSCFLLFTFNISQYISFKVATNGIPSEDNISIEENKDLLNSLHKTSYQVIENDAKELMKNNYSNQVNSAIKNGDKPALVKLYINILGTNNLSEKHQKTLKIANNYLKIDTLLVNKNYKGAVDLFLNHYTKEFTGLSLALMQPIINQLETFKYNLSTGEKISPFDFILQKQTGYKGFIGYKIFVLQGGIMTEDNDLGLGINLLIIVEIIKLIIFVVGIYIGLSIFSVSFCKIHKNIYENFGNEYFFPTILPRFKNIELNKIIKGLGTTFDRQMLESGKKQNYCNIFFTKCLKCENGENIINMIIENYSFSQIKPKMRFIKSSFELEYDAYIKLINILEKIKQKDTTIISNNSKDL